MDDAPSRPNGGLIASAILVVLLAAYLIAYFALRLDGISSIGPRPIRLHVYQHKWQADLFRPAARVEALFVGHDVETGHRN